MTTKDLKEISMWAAATAIVAVGLTVCRTAVGDGGDKKPTGPVAVVSGLRITATATETKPQILALDVTVNNPTDQAVTLNSKISVVRQEYYGNPISRTITPSDFKTVPLATHNLTGLFAVGQSKTLHLTDCMPPVAPATASVKTVAQSGGSAPATTTPTAVAANLTATRLATVANATKRAPIISYRVSVIDEQGCPLLIAAYAPLQTKPQ